MIEIKVVLFFVSSSDPGSGNSDKVVIVTENSGDASWLHRCVGM